MTTPKRKAPSKAEEPITVSEFKSWIAGVEDMQGTGWVPNKEQWNKIRAKIAALYEQTHAVSNTYIQPAPQPQPLHQYSYDGRARDPVYPPTPVQPAPAYWGNAPSSMDGPQPVVQPDSGEYIPEFV